nr:putative maintenance of ploidy protein mob1 [Quercus suber]
MFVTNTPLQPLSASPKPLPALSTRASVYGKTSLHASLLASSCSKFTFPFDLQRQIQNILHTDPHNNPFILLHNSHFSDAAKQKPYNRVGWSAGQQSLDVSIVELANKKLTPANSNARNRNQASFQPRKNAKGTNSWQLKQFAEATLGSGSLKKVVQLPEGENRDEWLAVNGIAVLALSYSRPEPGC